MSARPAARSKRVLFYALLGACLGVWGWVLLRLVQSFDPAAPPPAAAAPLPALADAPPAPVRPGPGATYEADFEDPFAWPPALQKPVAPPPASIRPVPVPPPLVLVGIVGETAMLRGEDEAVYLARPGDRVGAARLLRIEAGRVVLRHGGHTTTLALDQ